MKPAILITVLGLLLLLTSCDIYDDMPECSYNLQLEYWYGDVKERNNNVFNEYIQSLEEYIFDETGALIMVNRLPGSSCIGKNYSEINLPPGKYTVVSWGNRTAISKGAALEVGKTNLNDMMLYLDNPYPGTGLSQTSAASLPQSNSDRLFYGYRNIEISEERITRSKVFMQHSHCMLNVSVKWKNRPPADTKNFLITLNNVPYSSTYKPEYIIKGTSVQVYDEAVHAPITDEHLFIPNVNPLQRVTNHHLDVSMNMMQQVSGRFVCHRFRNDTHPILCIYTGGQALMKEVDLHKYFTTMDIELDRNLKQEFFIVVEIDGDNVSVMPATISDWEDGGSIGGII